MAQYVDGFVVPVPRKKIPAYRRMSQKAGKIWRQHGALDYRECVGDDLKIKGVLPFTRLARTKAGETVVFAWILYRSRAHRARVNAKVMKDPRMKDFMLESMPFDMKRMACGGFKVFVQA